MNRTSARVAAAAWLVAAVAAADTVTLRDEAFVQGPAVLLGDVAEIEGENAEALAGVELIQAASPGSVKRLSASLIESRLNAEGFGGAGVSVNGASSVAATTLHLDITRDMLTEDLRTYIERQMPWNIDAAMIDVVMPGSDYRVPDGRVSIAWRVDPQYRYLGQGSFRGEILVDGRVEQAFFARANIAAYDDVVVAVQPISRGDSIGPQNVSLERRELSSLREGAYFDVSDVSGMVAKTTIRPGEPLSDRRLAMPVVVERNQYVAVETRIGSLVVRAQARALQDGAVGDFINLKNMNSGLEMSGIVRRDGVVEVQ